MSFESELEKMRQVYQEHRLLKKLGTKARIAHIGFINERGEPEGWVFDAHGLAIAAIDIRGDGSILYGGWSVAELAVIAEEGAVL